MLLVTLATLGGTIYLYMIVPKGFFPQEDTGFLIGVTEAATDTSFEAMKVRQQALVRGAEIRSCRRLYQLDRRLRRPQSDRELWPDVHCAEAAENPRQRRRRDRPAAPEGAPDPGLKTYFQSIQNLNIGGRMSKANTSTCCRAATPPRSTGWRRICATRSRRFPGLLDVTTDLYIKNPQMTVEIDREKAAIYGVTVDQVRNQLYNAYGARQVGTIYMPSNDYQIILETQPQFRVDPSDLSKLYVKTANNQTIPLDVVARLVPTIGPLQINHQGQQPAVTISFNLAPGYSLGYAVDKITELEQTSNLPATIATGFSGTAQVFQDPCAGRAS